MNHITIKKDARYAGIFHNITEHTEISVLKSKAVGKEKTLEISNI
jgi:hypothetical protein